MAHVSFSALKNWNQCPFYYKLTYVDRIKGFEGNHYTAFGTALHTVCENVLNGSQENPNSMFDTEFLKELQSLPETVRSEITAKTITEMRDAGKRLSVAAVPFLKETFGDFELVATEEELMEVIELEQSQGYKFKGFICLLYTSDAADE